MKATKAIFIIMLAGAVALANAASQQGPAATAAAAPAAPAAAAPAAAAAAAPAATAAAPAAAAAAPAAGAGAVPPGAVTPGAGAVPPGAAKPAPDADLPISRGPAPQQPLPLPPGAADDDLAIANDEDRLPPSNEPPPPVCACPLPKDGGGYYGRGKDYVAYGCTCKNACEFAPSGKPSCATLCKCPNIGGGKGALRDISLQTFDSTRGPLRANFNNMFRHGRRLAGAATEGSLVVTA